MSGYKSSKRDLAIADDYLSGQAQCLFCNRMAERQELGMYGARCFECYKVYCHQNRHYPSLSIAQRKEMASMVKAALAGGLRAAPGEHIAYLMQLESEGKASAGQRGFLDAVRQHKTMQASKTA